MIKKTLWFLMFVLLVSCGSSDKKQQSYDSNTTEKDGYVGKELEYVKIRDSYIKYFKTHPENVSNGQVLFKQENDSLKDLENKLKDIMEECHVANISKRGKINLETLSEGLGFGKLDGLCENKDSMIIFCTSRKLFDLYFGEKLNHLDNLSSEELTYIFQQTFFSDVALIDYTYFKISASKDSQVYGMLCLTTQSSGPYSPNSLYVLTLGDKYVYMAEKDIKEGEIKNSPECQAVWDSLSSKVEVDTAFDRFCKCYRKTFKYTQQFKMVQKQLEEIAIRIED